MNVGIIGHFGGSENFADGQTIKTKELYSALKKNTDWSIIIVDTYMNKKNPVLLLYFTLKCLFKCESLIFLLSRNGLKVYLPIFYFFSKYLNKKIFHYIIGSNDVELLIKNPKWIKYYNAFVVNWSETEYDVEQLKGLGIKNAKQLSNFKNLTPIAKKDLKFYKPGEPFIFCTFSRVCEEKGISDAILACNEVKNKLPFIDIKLHIYGQIEPKYENIFFELLKDNQICEYKNIVPYNQSVEVLSNYFMLLFPTKWKAEGMPGTIIDSFAAGCPIIARDWNNSMIITRQVTGFVYPRDNFKSLSDTIEYCIQNNDIINKMRLNCINEYDKYSPSSIIKVIIDEISNNSIK